MTGLTRTDFYLSESLAVLLSKDLRVKTRAELYTGERYFISNTDLGSGILMGNGNYVNPVSTEIIELIKIKEVVSPYTVLQDDAGFILVFDDAGTAILNFPDVLTKGVSVMASNVGAGGVQGVNTGTDTTQGELLLGSASGYFAMTKITATIWQSSER